MTKKSEKLKKKKKKKTNLLLPFLFTCPRNLIYVQYKHNNQVKPSKTTTKPEHVPYICYTSQLNTKLTLSIQKKKKNKNKNKTLHVHLFLLVKNWSPNPNSKKKKKLEKMSLIFESTFRNSKIF